MQYELPTGYLSASSLNCLLTCPRQYEFRYIERVPVAPTASMLIGTALHKALEQYYRSAIADPANRLTPAQMAELAMATFGDVFTSEEHYIDSTEVEDAGVAVRDLAAAYAEHVAPTIVPLAVEEERVWLSRCGVAILSYIDLRHRRPDGSESICDYKITGKKWTLDKLVNSLQFNLYSMVTGIGDIEIHNMIKAAPGKRSSAKPVDDVIDVAPNLRILRHNFDGSANDFMEDLIESCARLITSGIFTPCAMDAWCCNPDWCGYWSQCRGKAQSKVTDLAA